MLADRSLYHLETRQVLVVKAATHTIHERRSGDAADLVAGVLVLVRLPGAVELDDREGGLVRRGDLELRHAVDDRLRKEGSGQNPSTLLKQFPTHRAELEKRWRT